jgi:hypothetical protein
VTGLADLHSAILRLYGDDLRWRVVCTDSESPDGVTPVCTRPEHPADDPDGVYDCCEQVTEWAGVSLAAEMVRLLNAVPELLALLDVSNKQGIGLAVWASDVYRAVRDLRAALDGG